MRSPSCLPRLILWLTKRIPLVPDEQPAARKRYLALPLVLIPALLLRLHAPGQEGYEHHPYRDVGGVWTVCGGLAGAQVDPKHAYTDDECKQRETAFAVKLGAAMGRCLREPLSWNEWMAYMLFGWNVGPTAFCNSLTVRQVNRGRHIEACDGMMHFHTAGGRDCRIRANQCYGVIRGRNVEISLCKSGAW